MELPHADAGLEGGAGARHGNTVVLKPAETTPLTAACSPSWPTRPGSHPACSTWSPVAGRRGAVVAHPEVDKVAFTGSTSVGKTIRRRLAGTGKRLTLELGGKGRTSSLTMRRSTRRSRGDQRHLLQPGPRLLRREPALRAGVDPRRLRRQAQERLATLRVGDPLDKNTDVGAINSIEQLDKITEWSAPARPRAPRCTSPSALSPTAGSGRRFSPGVAEPPDSPGGDLRPGPLHTHRTPDEAVERRTTRHTASRRGVDDQGSRILWMADRLRAGWCGPTRSTSSTRRPRSAGTAIRVRPRGRAPRAARLPQGRAGLMARLDVRKTAKLYIGGAFPRSESGRS